MTEPNKPAMQKVLIATALYNTADYDRPYFHVTVPNDVTLEDLQRPAFWAHHTTKLKVGALIDVVRENLSLDVQLRCLGAGVGFAKMRVLREWEDKEVAKSVANEATGAEPETALPPEYKITVSRGSFTLTYVPTDIKLESNLKTRAAAVAAAKAHAATAGITWPDEKAPAQS